MLATYIIVGFFIFILLCAVDVFSRSRDSYIMQLYRKIKRRSHIRNRVKIHPPSDNDTQF